MSPWHWDSVTVERWAKEWLSTLASHYSHGVGGEEALKELQFWIQRFWFKCFLQGGVQTFVFYKISTFRRNTSSLSELFLFFQDVFCVIAAFTAVPQAVFFNLCEKKCVRIIISPQSFDLLWQHDILMSFPPVCHDHSQRYHPLWWSQCEALSRQ